ncbi:MAG: type II secretion system F family protein [Candidatus Hadarchaeota archaeon]
MPKEKKEDRSLIKRFFGAIGRGVIGTGKATGKLKEKIGEGSESEEESELKRRLRGLKELESDKEYWEMEQTDWEEEETGEEEWEGERRELNRPVSDRVADVFYGPLKTPGRKLADFFTGLEDDLDRANMRISAQRYSVFLLGIGVITSIVTFTLVWLLTNSLLFSPLLSFVSFMIAVVVGRFRPKSIIGSRASEVNQQIPYALRHMAAQLSSGVGLPESMASVAKADYGALSDEFRRALREMRTGKSMNDSLVSMRERVGSDHLRSAVRQIQRTLRTGGNLAKTLDNLADEAAFDMRMNLRDYTQSLNMMTMIYMFGAAVIPSLLVVVMIVGNFIGGGFLTPTMMNLLYLGILPFMLFYLVIIFKRMEPEV